MPDSSPRGQGEPLTHRPVPLPFAQHHRAMQMWGSLKFVVEETPDYRELQYIARQFSHFFVEIHVVTIITECVAITPVRHFPPDQ